MKERVHVLRFRKVNERVSEEYLTILSDLIRKCEYLILSYLSLARASLLSSINKIHWNRIVNCNLIKAQFQNDLNRFKNNIKKILF